MVYYYDDNKTILKKKHMHIHWDIVLIEWDHISKDFINFVTAKT